MRRRTLRFRPRRGGYRQTRYLAWMWLLLVAVLVAADRFSKMLVVAHMQLGEDIPVLGPLLHFYYLRNTGAAFSMLDTLPNGRWILAGFTVVLIGVCVWALLAQKVRGRLGNFAFSLIIAGGIGNLIDRVHTGEVVDFLYLKCIHFAIFNVADSFVVIGAVLLCLTLLLQENRSAR